MTEDERSQRTLSAYDLGTVQEIHHHAGTAAKTWRVKTDRGTWLLRTRGSRTSTDELIAFDHGLRRHLVRHGIPTAEPVTNREGTRFVRLPGRTIGQADLAQIRSAAEVLARFHRAGEDYPVDVPPVAQYRTLGLARESTRMESPCLLSCVYKRLAEGAKARFPAAQTVAADWLRRLREEFPDAVYNALPQTMTHGDFTLANLLFAPDETVCGVFDFDWSRRGPRVRDVADGMFFVAGQRRTPLAAGNIWSLTEAADLTVEHCAHWLRSYHTASPLTAEELAAIPLALGARWLSVRVEGTAKVPPEDRLRFTFGNLPQPLVWLTERWGDVLQAVGG
jgi:Ser/Thr protein kinase RdoA (MazF antagonist)